MEEALEIIHQLLAHHMNTDISQIHPQCKLQDLGLDVMDVAELVFDAEDYFFIKPRSKVTQQTTVSELAAMFS